MTEQWERTMPCKDNIGRDRELRVFIADDVDGNVRVGFHVPAGEVATLPPRELSTLESYIAAARLEAVRRGGAWG